MIEEVTKQVSELLKNDNSGHGMDHIRRVVNLSLKLTEKEKADRELVALIALLHDVDDYKIFGTESAENLTNAKKILEECAIDAVLKKQVLDAIQTIGFSKRLRGIEPKTLEAKIVSDADMCDILGANGILRVYMYHQKNESPFFDRNVFPVENMTIEKYKKCADSGICHLFEKALKIKEFLLTKSGKEEAESRFQMTTQFLYHFFDEENAQEWIEYLDNFIKKNE